MTTTAPGANGGRTRAPAALLRTLSIDVGGTGLKASVLDSEGTMVVDRVRVDTTYPCPPEQMVDKLAELVAPLPEYDRVSVGFPGMVRGGRILSAPHFVTVGGPGTPARPDLVKAWSGFDLANQLHDRFGKPTRVVNDADMQGAAVVSGNGLEVVITLGTGLGTAVFYEGQLTPHLELAHHPFRKNESYNEQIGDAARRRIGPVKWNKRVRLAVETLDALLFFDHLYVGGGNGKKVTADLGPKATLVDNAAGILGGIKLWERTGPVESAAPRRRR